VLRSIAYVSRASHAFIPEDLDALLLDARMFNASVEVTGVLFHHAGRFFQYIEGFDDSIAEVYKRILQASSHTDIEKLLDTRIQHRYFETWHMAFCEAPETAVQQLANSSWEQSMPITRDEFDGFKGLSLAVYYWNKWSSEKSSSPLLVKP
jgi:hypothetical protein